MSVGVLSTLLSTLQASPILTGAGVSVAFGEEMINAEDVTIPKVVLVPGAGSYGPDPGYYLNADVNVDWIWGLKESIDLYLVAYATTVGAQPIDHADAVESLRQLVLQAIKSQADSGLKWTPVSGRWVTDANAVVRYGRAYVLTVQVDIAIPDVTPTEVTVTSLTLNQTI